MKKTILTLFLSALAGVTLTAGEFANIHNLRIVLPDQPSEIEKFAAGELKEHLSKTFTAPAVFNGKKPERIDLFVGLSSEAIKSGFTGDYAEAKKESKFGIYRNNNDLLFVGFDTVKGNVFNFKESCGTLLAVEYFAQKYLQSKFFLPGKDGVKYAINPAIDFAGTVDIPSFSYEVRGFQNAARDVDKNEMMLFFRRRLGQVPRWSTQSAFYTFLNKWNKRFKHKPEMFGLHNNKRINASYPLHFPCPSHPDTIPQVVSDVKKMLEENPNIYSIRFFCDAPVKNCTCTQCVDSPAGKLVVGDDRSEFVFAFFCKIAGEVKKIKPDLIFHLQTKSTHFQPPRTEKLPENTLIAVLSGHFNAPDYPSLQNRCIQWKNAGAKVVLYSYPRAPEMKSYPIMNPHRIADHLKKMQGYAFGATMAEGKAKVPYSFSALNTYVHSALMFDTTLDTDKLITGFCQLVAPQAAAELEDYYRAMEKLLEGAEFRAEPLTNCYLYFKLKTPRMLLDKALKKSPENKFLQTLSKDFAGFEKIAGDAAADFVNEEGYNELQAMFAYRQEAFKLTESGKVLDFKPFALYREFQKSSVKLSRQQDKLVLDFNCKEKYIRSLRMSCQENHSAAIWKDDVLEVFISNKGQDKPYIHLTINPRGVYQATKYAADGTTEILKDLKLDIAAQKGAADWSLKVNIPLSEIAKIAQNDRIDVAFYRIRTGKGKTKKQISGTQKPDNGSHHSVSGRFTVEL